MAGKVGLEPTTFCTKNKWSTIDLLSNSMAGSQGFEPWEDFHPRRFSKPVLSTTQPAAQTLAPSAGLEPATIWLTVRRSTNWAKRE